jgi:hypothetical protein
VRQKRLNAIFRAAVRNPALRAFSSRSPADTVGSMNVRLALAPLTLIAAYACLPHPPEDYERFLKDTETLRVGAVSDASVDAKPPTEGVQGVYFAACYSDLMAGNLHKSLRFFVQTDFVPTGQGGKLTLKLYPLKSVARTIAQSEAVGDPLVFDQSTVQADGKFSASVARGVIPGEGNPFSGRQIVATPLLLDGRFGAKEQFCANFVAKVTEPIIQDVTAQCLFFSQAPGAVFSLSGDAAGPTGPSDSLTVSSGVQKTANFVCQ